MVLSGALRHGVCETQVMMVRLAEHRAQCNGWISGICDKVLFQTWSRLPTSTVYCVQVCKPSGVCLAERRASKLDYRAAGQD
jgi:hypothetical protein